MKYIDVNTGNVVVCSEHYILRSLAIGSCIVLMAYDYTVRSAGMAHIMLPGNSPSNTDQPCRYAGNAIERLLESFNAAGSSCSNIEIALVGAGNVLKDPADMICAENINSVQSILSCKGISVSASILGGYERKAAFLNIATGKMYYSISGGKQRLLWPV